MIPEVNSVTYEEDGSYRLPEKFTVQGTDFEDWCMKAFCIRYDRTWIQAEHKSAETDSEEMELVKDLALLPEEYRIQVKTSGIQICAAKEIGVVWALTTLGQMMDEEGRVRCCRIEDAPRYSHRGLLLDCVRHFFKVEEVKKVIEEISRVKMNVLHWHLSDDHGFRIESHKYPLLHEQCKTEYYTQEEIREVVEYAGIRGVEIIPEIEMPGHTTGILAAYPQYSCSGQQVTLAKSGGIYPIVLCPGTEQTYQFLDELLAEICDLFPSEWFHIGGDETPGREWKSCDCCKAKMKAEHLQTTRELQGYFSNRVKKILKKYHKKIICWNDSLEAANFERGDDMKIQYWSIQFADSSQKFIREGGKFIYSDMFELYLDYPCSMSPIERVYTAKPLLRGEDYSDSEQMTGLEGCLWTEHLAEEKPLEERLFPRVYALAENAWSSKKDYESFKRRLEPYIEEARKRKIYSLSVERSNPSGKEKQEETKAYMDVVQAGIANEVREVTMEYSNPTEEFTSRFMELFFGIKENI